MGVGRVFGAALGHGGAGYAYHIESISARPGDASAEILWTDPCDADWVGTKIIRKIGTYPKSVTDGVLAADCQVRNQYAQTPYLDTGLLNGTTYCYMAFPYSQKGCNVSFLNRAEQVTPIDGGYWWTYSGAHTSQVLTVDGVARRLIVITGSGTFNIEGCVIGDVCLVGGGQRGHNAGEAWDYDQGTEWYAGGGGSGGKMEQGLGVELATSAIEIGAGGTSYYGGTTTGFGLSALGYGGSGGGRAWVGWYNQTILWSGDQTPKYPFGIESLLAHCAGGGGGGRRDGNSASALFNVRGGDGGTNGGNGGPYVLSAGSDGLGIRGGYGGVFGGGNANQNIPSDSVPNPLAATFYGGGGGGGHINSQIGSRPRSPGANGYQGVAYILLPDDKEEAV